MLYTTTDGTDGAVRFDDAAPLQYASQGRYKHLLPLDVLFVHEDGSLLHDDDCPLGAEYLRWSNDATQGKRNRSPVTPVASPRSTTSYAATAAGFVTSSHGRHRQTCITDTGSFTFVDAFCGMSPVSKVLADQSHLSVAGFDASLSAQDKYSRAFPGSYCSSDLASVLTDPDFEHATKHVDVVIATPPCRTYSPAGNSQLDSVPDGRLLYECVAPLLQVCEPKVLVLECPPTVPTADSGRIFDRCIHES